MQLDIKIIQIMSFENLFKDQLNAGIDVFRIFDSLNWVKGMEVAIDAVRQYRKNCRSGYLLYW